MPSGAALGMFTWMPFGVVSIHLRGDSDETAGRSCREGDDGLLFSQSEDNNDQGCDLRFLANPACVLPRWHLATSTSYASVCGVHVFFYLWEKSFCDCFIHVSEAVSLSSASGSLSFLHLKTQLTQSLRGSGGDEAGRILNDGFGATDEFANSCWVSHSPQGFGSGDGPSGSGGSPCEVSPSPDTPEARSKSYYARKFCSGKTTSFDQRSAVGTPASSAQSPPASVSSFSSPEVIVPSYGYCFGSLEFGNCRTT